MNPGMPGTGIGGLFYVLSALWMPVCEVWRRRCGDASGRWRLVTKQFAIAVGVVIAMSGVFWALDSVLLLYTAAQQAMDKTEAIRAMRVSALLVTTGVLFSLLGAVHLVRLFLWLRGLRSADQ